MTTLDIHSKLYEIAESQAGYFTSRQATEAGCDRSQLTRQVAAGRLRRIRRGLYRLVYFPASAYEDLVVAWLETGPDSVISHDSALSLYELSDALPAETHVTVPRTASRRHPGVRLHTGRLTHEEITSRYGMSVTTVPRTIADVAAAGLSEELVIQAVRQAVAGGLAAPGDLLAAGRSRRVRDLIQRALKEGTA